MAVRTSAHGAVAAPAPVRASSVADRRPACLQAAPDLGRHRFDHGPGQVAGVVLETEAHEAAAPPGRHQGARAPPNQGRATTPWAPGDGPRPGP